MQATDYIKKEEAMSSLPQYPSLERLKNEAKSIRKAIKSGDKEARQIMRLHGAFADLDDETFATHDVTLRQVQHVLATRHGFSSWNKLVKEVKEQRESGADKSFDELLESVYDAVIITTMRGNAFRFNARCFDYLDYTKKEMASMNVMKIIYGAVEETLKTIHKTLISERRVFIEGFCIKKDGSVFPADIAVSILHIGGETYMVYFIRNISTRVQAQEALRKTQAEMIQAINEEKQFLDGIEDGAFSPEDINKRREELAKKLKEVGQPKSFDEPSD